MTLSDESFTSTLFAEDEPVFDGARRLFARAGTEITTVDLVTAADLEAGLTLDRMGELALVLGLEPQIEHQTLSGLMLHAALFAFEDSANDLWLFMPGPDGRLVCLDLEGAEPHAWPDPDVRGRALVFADTALDGYRAPPVGSLRTILAWTGKPLVAIVGITFASNVLGLTLPLFTLAVYDQVLAAGDPQILAMLVIGLGLGLLADLVLRLLRNKMVSRSAAHLDVRLTSRIFGNMLRRMDGTRLPPPSATLARLRELDRIRGFLFGPIGISLIEGPFALIYVAILVLLLGWVALVPLGFLALGMVIASVLLASASRRGRAALARAEEYGALCTEISGRLETIRAEASEAHYESRFCDASARMAEAELLQQRTAQIVQLGSNVLVSLAVLLTLVTGALVAMDDTLGIGALIASIALVWRMSAPLPSLLQAQLRFPDVRAALAGASEGLAPAGTDAIREGSSGGRAMSGRIAFSSVNFTYGRGQTAALRNLSFTIGAGELVAVTGHSGAGKSTMLDLVSGLLEPQFGSVTIDGVNPQQVAPSTLRQSIGYLPRGSTTFPLEIREFLRVGVDPVERSGIDDICARLGLDGAIGALPEGDRTSMLSLPADGGLVRGLSLARVLATRASLLLLDEPDAASRAAREGLLAELRALKGNSTVILVTQEPSFIAMADRVLILNDGMLTRNCTPHEIAGKRRA